MSLGSIQAFGSLTAGATRLVERIDSDKLTELLVTDVTAMVLPRTWIEYSQRGADAGRETLIREIAGTMLNCFASGWFGTLALKLMRHTKGGFLNPLGLDHRQWIQTKHLDVFGRQLSQAVQNPNFKTAEQMLTAFTDDFFRGLASTDGIGQLPVIQKHLRHPHPGQLGQLARRDLVALMLETPQAGSRYTQWYQPILEGFINAGPRQQKRLSLMKERLVRGGLTSEVCLKDTAGKTLIQAVGRDKVLSEFSAFMDVYVRRLFPKGKNPSLTTAVRRRALRLLNGAPGKNTGLLPHRLDGLLPYARKSKIFLSVVPFAVVVAISCSIGWLNNRYTRQKNNGQVFFPGEAVFKAGGQGR